MSGKNSAHLPTDLEDRSYECVTELWRTHFALPPDSLATARAEGVAQWLLKESVLSLSAEDARFIVKSCQIDAKEFPPEKLVMDGETLSRNLSGVAEFVGRILGARMHWPFGR